MSNPEYQRSRRASVIGLFIVSFILVVLIVGLFWGAASELWPLWVVWIPIIFGPATTTGYWWWQKKRWPDKDL